MKMSAKTAVISQPHRDSFLAQTSSMLVILLLMLVLKQDLSGLLAELLSR